MAFQFSLETLLQHRQNLEDQARLVFYGAQSSLTELENQLQLYREEIQNSMGNTELSHGEFYLQKANYLAALKERIAEQYEMISIQKETVKEKQILLKEASQELEVLVKLKDKRQKEYDARKRKKEANSMDELSTQGFYRKRAI
jgi:flagellar export protein FliJ